MYFKSSHMTTSASVEGVACGVPPLQTTQLLPTRHTCSACQCVVVFNGWVSRGLDLKCCIVSVRYFVSCYIHSMDKTYNYFQS